MCPFPSGTSSAAARFDNASPPASVPEAHAEARRQSPPQQDSFGYGDTSRSYPGTGWGHSTYDPVQIVDFDPHPTPVQLVTIRYEYASALRALGVLPHHHWTRDRSRPQHQVDRLNVHELRIVQELMQAGFPEASSEAAKVPMRVTGPHPVLVKRMPGVPTVPKCSRGTSAQRGRVADDLVATRQNPVSAIRGPNTP